MEWGCGSSGLCSLKIETTGGIVDVLADGEILLDRLCQGTAVSLDLDQARSTADYVVPAASGNALQFQGRPLADDVVRNFVLDLGAGVGRVQLAPRSGFSDAIGTDSGGRRYTIFHVCNAHLDEDDDVDAVVVLTPDDDRSSRFVVLLRNDAGMPTQIGGTHVSARLGTRDISIERGVVRLSLRRERSRTVTIVTVPTGPVQHLGPGRPPLAAGAVAGRPPASGFGLDSLIPIPDSARWYLLAACALAVAVAYGQRQRQWVSMVFAVVAGGCVGCFLISWPAVRDVMVNSAPPPLPATVARPAGAPTPVRDAAEARKRAEQRRDLGIADADRPEVQYPEPGLLSRLGAAFSGRPRSLLDASYEHRRNGRPDIAIPPALEAYQMSGGDDRAVVQNYIGLLYYDAAVGHEAVRDYDRAAALYRVSYAFRPDDHTYLSYINADLSLRTQQAEARRLAEQRGQATDEAIDALIQIGALVVRRRLPPSVNLAIRAVEAYASISDFAERHGCAYVSSGRSYWNVGCTLNAARTGLARTLR